jgi:pimeloyl-ACP methyl ester carboxylesterase
LADPLHVLEPWQRRSSSVPLTVDRHVEDLARVISREIPGEKPALVGASWGAMLALVFTSRYSDPVSAIVLIGCGTFDRQARARLHDTLAQRTSPELKAQLAELESRFPDEKERLVRAHRLSESIYTYCRAAGVEDPVEHLDPKGQAETWDDMLRLQESGVYPARFASIQCPVLMLHGTYDPHPGPMIRDSLKPYIPNLEYREYDRCGHSPWIEEHVRERFLVELRTWLEQQRRL